MSKQYDFEIKKIKTYKLPLKDRVAYYFPVFVWLFWLVVSAMIVTPTIYYNYEKIWYYFLISPVIFFFVKYIIAVIKFFVYDWKYKTMLEEEAESDASYQNLTGVPGSGKSYGAKELIYAKSKYAWEDLQFEIWLLLTEIKKSNFEPTEEQKEILDAYEFYIKNEGVPCMVSTIPCYSKTYKRYSYELETGHLKQKKRLPYKSCMFIDEVGTIANFSLNSDARANKDGAVDMDDFFRFIRQFLEAKAIGTEQDGENIFIGLRRVADDNKCFDRKQWVLKPRFLLWVYKKMRNHFVSKMRYSEAKIFSKFMKNFKKFIYSCGFFKLTYKSRGNFVTGAKREIVVVLREKKTCYYFPRISEINYDTRAFAKAYKPRLKSIEMNVFESMKLTREQAMRFLKSENLSKKEEQKEQKKTTGDSLPF